jgi:thiol:disulfide interchange protein/DsbC/DsbD-like thiol-disulfide interchange protein
LGASRVLRYTVMMIRILFLALIAATATAHASDPISAPAQGASATVTQPHVTAELIPETTAVQAGQPFDVALHLHMDAGWHTYWINPGDAGLATRITWTLPPGFTAGPIQWPTPEKHSMGPLVTYGYGGDVYLLTTLTPPKDNLPQHFDVKAKASWLVCQEECIPGKAELTLSLDSGLMNLRLPQNNQDFFTQARERLPVSSGIKPGNLANTGNAGSSDIEIGFVSDLPLSESALKNIQFFPEQPNVFSNTDQPQVKAGSDARHFSLIIKRQQNGDAPSNFNGVLVANEPLVGDSKAVYVGESSEGQVAVGPSGAQPPGQASSPVPMGNNGTEGTAASSVSPPVASTQSAPAASGAAVPPSGGPDNSLSGLPQATGGRASVPINSQPAPADTTLLAVLGAAFLGGLILNLMPCVLPVLSLKVFSLMKHAGENPKAAWIQGVAFTAGVIVSFWILAGLLIALRTAGNHLGWGFQMQDPRFVLGLIFLFFLLALNLFGLFELGASLVGLDAKAAGKLDGTASSFGNGALATVAATPCTAPFMGSALGFAAQQPASVSLLIFTFLALGMATPYLLLTIFPGALRFIPKPGAWMEAFKQFMGFLLMATVIFLVYVFGALVGEDQVPWLLFVLLLAGLAAWIYGKWATPLHSTGVRTVAFVLALGFLGYAIFWGVGLANATPPEIGVAQNTNPDAHDNWQPWTQTAVDATLAKGQPVFVDFTAAWCLSCKVNERVALGTDAVKAAFTQKNVALFRADWTHSDPAISNTLQKFNRDGVPLYLLYSPKSQDAPQVLPEVLTPGIVLAAIDKL